jgi:hypothetical protein
LVVIQEHYRSARRKYTNKNPARATHNKTIKTVRKLERNVERPGTGVGVGEGRMRVGDDNGRMVAVLVTVDTGKRRVIDAKGARVVVGVGVIVGGRDGVTVSVGMMVFDGLVMGVAVA